MPNNRTKGNGALRKHIKAFLKKIKPKTLIYTNHIVMELSKINKNYNINSQRVANLLGERKDVVKSDGYGVWMKL